MSSLVTWLQGQTQLQRASSGTDPLQLQEYYAAQSDIIEELIKGHNTRDPSLLAAAVHGEFWCRFPKYIAFAVLLCLWEGKNALGM